MELSPVVLAGIPAIAFAVLAPGALLSLPPSTPVSGGTDQVFFTGHVTPWNVILHTVVFFIVMYIFVMIALRRRKE